MESQINSLGVNIQPKGQTIEKTEESARAEMSKEVVMRHLNSFLDNNLEALISDYTNESVLITQAATYTTVEEIKAFFVSLSLHFPQQVSNFQLERVVAYDDLVFIVWHAKTPSVQVPIGSDTFIIKDGKIYQQTFVGLLNFTKE